MLVERFEEMIKLAKLFNARVCINLNPRSFEKTGFQLMSKIAHQMENKDFLNISKAYDSVCGNYHAEIDKRWIIDIDLQSMEYVNYVVDNIIEIQSKITNKVSEVLEILPTKAGFHIITNPFNVEEFKNRGFTEDIHKNNPTILWMPLN